MIEKLEECVLLSKQQNEYIKVIKEGVESLKEHYRIACEYNEIADKKIEELNNIINELEKWLEEEKDRLARETSNIYEDSLGKTRLVNEDIFNEVTKIKSKLQELKGSNSNE